MSVKPIKCARVIAVFTLACVAVVPLKAETTAAKSRPNIVLIISDDHRWDCIGAAGNPSVKTPNLDELAREGVHFRQATIHTPQCSPCRASLLTGLPPHKNGWFSNQTQAKTVASPDGFSHLPTVPGELAKGGYRTVLVGKWHLKPDPWKVGFTDVRTWLPGGGGPFKDVRLAKGNSREVTTVSGYLQDVLGNDVADFIRSPQAKEKPFFVWLALTAPHMPLKPNPAHLVDLYKDKSNAELAPPGFTVGTPEEQFTSFTIYAARKAKKANKTDEEQTAGRGGKRGGGEVDWHHYYAAVSSADEQVGRVRQALKDTGHDANTVIVFIGDNGMMRGSRGWDGKVLPYDESVRVPMVVSAPGTVMKGTSDAAVSSADLSPSFLQWAGVPVPKDWPGRDLGKLVASKDADGFEQAFCEFADNTSNKFGTMEYRLVRTPESKLIVWRDPAKGEEFFDLKRDPRELRNEISNPLYGAQVSALRKELTAWQQRTSDDMGATRQDLVTGEGED